MRKYQEARIIPPKSRLKDKGIPLISRTNYFIENSKGPFFRLLEKNWETTIPYTKTNEKCELSANENFKKIYEPVQNLVNHLLQIGVY